MSFEREVRRYAAYFRGWCQAFGEHEGEFQEDDDVSWLYGQDQIGLILAPAIRKTIQREMLGKHSEAPIMTLAGSDIRIGDFRQSFNEARDVTGLDHLIGLLRDSEIIHLYLTYHIMYPPGTRIVTFSRRSPLPIFYKEIKPLLVRVI